MFVALVLGLLWGGFFSLLFVCFCVGCLLRGGIFRGVLLLLLFIVLLFFWLGFVFDVAVVVFLLLVFVFGFICCLCVRVCLLSFLFVCFTFHKMFVT